jgi:hypothetical protein
MKTSRIEIPLTLEAPRFEDELTVTTARRVKPIGRTRVTFRFRKVTAMLPLFLAATLCGALGAAGVNYYEHRRPVSVPSPETTVTKNPAPAAATNSSAVSSHKIAENQTAELSPTIKVDEATTKDLPKTAAETDNDRRDEESRESVAAKVPKAENERAAAKLTRQRRVRPPEPAPVNKNGAGRIADLFSGPNP